MTSLFSESTDSLGHQAISQTSETVIEDESEVSYFAPHEESGGPAVLEALPLLRRSSVYLDRFADPVYPGSEDGEPLVRVQSGVKKVEAITMLWTRGSLIIAYVR
jgi:hypothetical protein